jgi:hypothetical protein
MPRRRSQGLGRTMTSQAEAIVNTIAGPGESRVRIAGQREHVLAGDQVGEQEQADLGCVAVEDIRDASWCSPSGAAAMAELISGTVEAPASTDERRLLVRMFDAAVGPPRPGVDMFTSQAEFLGYRLRA